MSIELSKKEIILCKVLISWGLRFWQILLDQRHILNLYPLPHIFQLHLVNWRWVLTPGSPSSLTVATWLAPTCCRRRCAESCASWAVSATSTPALHHTLTSQIGSNQGQLKLKLSLDPTLAVSKHWNEFNEWSVKLLRTFKMILKQKNCSGLVAAGFRYLVCIER